MAGRNMVLATNEIYHIFNRGVEHRQIFTDKRDYRRALETVEFYQHNTELKFSDVKNLPLEQRSKVLQDIFELPKLVEVICFCFLPNHFHLLLKQLLDNGISNFVSKFTNSYTRYFNTKNERDGSLFRGTFKSVRVESQGQFLQVSRYIHFNPVASYLAKLENLEDYPWSSFKELLRSPTLVQKELILSSFKTIDKYKEFVYDKIGYSSSLENIKDKLFE